MAFKLHLDTSVVAFAVDPKGNKLTNKAGDRIQIAQDTLTGKIYAKICDALPSDDDEKSVAKRKAVLAQNPVSFTSDVSGFTGLWVELVDDPTDHTDESAKPNA